MVVQILSLLIYQEELKNPVTMLVSTAQKRAHKQRQMEAIKNYTQKVKHLDRPCVHIFTQWKANLIFTFHSEESKALSIPYINDVIYSIIKVFNQLSVLAYQ